MDSRSQPSTPLLESAREPLSSWRLREWELRQAAESSAKAVFRTLDRLGEKNAQRFLEGTAQAPAPHLVTLRSAGREFNQASIKETVCCIEPRQLTHPNRLVQTLSAKVNPRSTTGILRCALHPHQPRLRAGDAGTTAARYSRFSLGLRRRSAAAPRARLCRKVKPFSAPPRRQ